MKKKKTTKRYSFLAWLGATCIIFVALVNTIPSIVTSTSTIPVVGQVIKAVEFDSEPLLKTKEGVNIESTNVSVYGNPIQELSFIDGKASGGKITDNSNVKSISLSKEHGAEQITINFTNRGDVEQPLLVAPYFEITYYENPYTMAFSIYGARAFDANDFKDLKKSEFVEDAYWLVTHDDSLIRFVIVFNRPMVIEGTEYADPAQIVIRTSPDEQPNNVQQYAVRTTPLLFGGEIAQLEEHLFEEEGIRILRENGILFSSWESEFYLEIGLFDDKEKAEQRILEINEKYGSDIQLFIEER